MAVVLKTWRPTGTLVISPLSMGGIFVETLIRPRSAGSGTVTYPSLVGRGLRIFQVYATEFTWVNGVSNGVPYITFTVLPAGVLEGEIRLLIFAT